MGARPVVFALERHYATTRGLLIQIEEEIVAAGTSGDELRERKAPEIEPLREALVHIEFCLRLFDPDWTSDHIKPVRTRAKSDPDKWSRLLNWAYDVLREATEPMSSSEILDAVWKADRITRAERQEFRGRLTSLMRGQQKVGAVRSKGARPLRWEIIKSR